MKIKRNQQADFRTEKYTRFGIRKYSFGAASVAIATGLMFLGSGTVSANELTSKETGDQVVVGNNESDLLKENQKTESTYEAPAVIPGMDSKESQGSENNKETQLLSSESTTNSVVDAAVENSVEKVEHQLDKSNTEDRSVYTDAADSLKRTRRDLDSSAVVKEGGVSITPPKENTSSDSSHPNGYNNSTKYHDGSDGWYTFVQLDQQERHPQFTYINSFDGYVVISSKSDRTPNGYTTDGTVKLEFYNRKNELQQEIIMDKNTNSSEFVYKYKKRNQKILINRNADSISIGDMPNTANTRNQVANFYILYNGPEISTKQGQGIFYADGWLIPTNNSVTVRFKDKDTNKELVPSRTLNGLTGMRFDTTAAELKGYELVDKEIVGASNGYISPWKQVGDSFTKITQPNLEIKYTLLNMDGTMKAEVYYSGNKIHETTLRKGETTEYNGTAANKRPYVQRIENPFLNATNEIIYYYKATAPVENDVTKSTKQTVTFEGAGTATPADKVQDNFTFTGKQNPTTNITTWDQSTHTYGKETVPVVDGFYADKTEAGSKTVTPDQPEVTDKVTYNPLGSLVPKSDDPKFPSTPEVKYPNDPNDPTKPGKPVVPDVPGYEPHLPDPNDPTKPGKPVTPGTPITPENPGTDTPIIYVPKTTEVTKPTKQTVTFEGAGEDTPTTNVQDSFTFTGKHNPTTNTTTWNEASHTYGKLIVPVVDGYYSDKTEAGSKTVTPDQPEVTDHVVYKPLGKIIQVDEAGNVIPGSVSKTYENNPWNPKEAAETKIPDAPAGYKIKEEQPQAWGYNIVDKTIEPNDESDPDRISRDTPIIYVPIVNDVTKPTKQTVTFEGAGEDTPTTNVQNSFTFTGKHNPTTNTTTWNEASHTYGKLIVPVVDGYYSDKTEAGSKTVTPDQPEVTDKVTYKPLGKIIPVDPEGNKIPSAPTPQYNNDSEDPTKGGETPTPVIPGYVTDIPSVTPNKPGEDTPVVYRKAEQKAIIKYVDQNTGTTLENDQLSGKSGEAIDYSTTAKIQNYQDRGYVLVSDEFPAGATYDTDPSVDQTWTVTLKHGETPVGPNNPHKPTEPIKPNDPDSPKYPAEDQWKKDVTSTVHYVVSDGNATAPVDNVQNAQWTRTLTLDKVTGEVLSSTPWAANKANYDAVPTPGMTGYYADKGSVASKTVTQENLEETVTYRPLGKLVPKPETPNDPNFPSTPEVKYPNNPNDPTKPGQPVVPNVPGYKPYLPDPNDPTKPDKDKPVEPGKELPNLPTNPGDDTPIIYVPIVNYVTKPTKQTVKFEGAGDKTPADKVQDDFTFTGKVNRASGTTTWNEKSHTYGKVSVPVIPGYYADKTEAGGKTVTPENPEATDTVTYKPLGSLVPKSDDPKFPSTPDVKYPNDPTDPGKPGKPVVPDVPGYKPYLPDPKDPSKPGQPVEPGKELPNLPTNPGEDTPIIYVPIVPKTPNVPTPEPRPETPGTPNPEPKPLNPEKVVRELPNTGTDSNTVMTGLGIIGMATTLLGLAQKKKED